MASNSAVKFKQTEIGIIPVDWDAKELRDIIIFSNGRPSEMNVTENGAYKLITLDSIDINGKLKASHRRVNKYESFLKKNDIVMVLSDIAHAKLLGLCDLIPNDNEYVLNQRMGCLRVKGVEDPEYIRLQVNSRQDFFRSRGQGTSQRHIYQKDVDALKIPVPSDRSEQVSISVALSNADLLVEKLEKLIQKKRNIKQGAMQELLTGKRRLPGFSGEWEKKRLGDLLDYEQPTKYLVKSTDYSDSYNIPVLTAGKTFVLGYTAEETGLFQKLPVIIFDDFTTAIKYVDFPFKAKSSAMKMLVPRSNDVNLKFVFAKMQLMDFKLGDHKRYWISEYQNLEIETPGSDEQTAIASFLSDMDAEIQELKSQLSKYQNLKQGMMQTLLTGKIRLI